VKQRKVLIVGKANHLGWLEHTASGFTQAGYHTNIFAINKLPAIDKLLLKIKRTFDHKRGNEQLGTAFHKKIKSFQPDLIMVVSAFFIPLELYEIAQSHNIPIAAWAGDKFGDDALAYQPFINKFYASDTALVSIAEKMSFSGSELLQFGYNKSLHNDQQLPRSNQFNFVGSFTKERDEVFKNLTDYPLVIKGSGWNNLSSVGSKWIVQNTTVSPKQLTSLYNTTMATLNVAQLNNVINMVNMRTFEAIACGSCMINDNVGDLSLCFEPGKEVLVYNSIEELTDICAKITKEPSFASKIAKNGIKRLHESGYGYDEKAQKIMTDLGLS
jgi:spore maturation protein CgeB